MSIETQPSSWAGNPVPGRPSGDRLSPPDTLLRTIADRWGLVLGGMFACALLASVVSLRAPTLYEAHATIVVSSPSDDPNLQAQAVTNARTILENRTNANTVIKQVGLDQAPDPLDPGTLVSRRLMVQQVRDTNYLTVTLRASSPSKAENALKALLQGGIGLSNHLGDADRNPAQSAWMHEQLLSAREALDRAGDKLIAFEKQEEMAQLHKEPARTADKSEQKIDADLARRWERSKLELDVLLATRAYADVVARLDKSKASAASRNVSISIADEPLAGQSQVSPRVWLSAAVGATLGLLGMALALTAFWSGRSVLSGSSPEP